MSIKFWYLDFDETNQMWHIDLDRVPENEAWRNIGYGTHEALSHFCNFVDMMIHEFGLKYTTEQVTRMAECTPGITIHKSTPIPEEQFEKDVHMAPIYSKERIEQHINWELIEK